MRKTLKITLIVLGVLIGIVLLDSFQAIVFSNNPIIGVETKCMKKAGILIDTYHCANNKNIAKIKKFNPQCNGELVCGKRSTSEIEKEIRENVDEILNIIEEDGLSSNPEDFIKNKYYKHIVSLGKDAVPVIINMHDKGEFIKYGLNDLIMAIAVQEIANCNLEKEYNLTYTSGDDFFELWKEYNCGFN